MMATISEIWNTSKSEHKLSLNVMEILLGPASDHVIKRDNLQIKEALSEFLTSINRFSISAICDMYTKLFTGSPFYWSYTVICSP